MKIDYTNLCSYLKNTSPYIFVDKAEVVLGKYAKGIKNFAYNEWFFQCHFPGDPVVPGVFQIEAITQTAALAIHPLAGMEGKKILVKKFLNVDFINGVYPGDQLIIESNIKSFKRGIIIGHGDTFVIRKEVKLPTCSADFQMIVPELFVALAPKK